MNPDDLDKILLTEKPVEPSSSFMVDIMARIEAEASYARRIPVPWILPTAIAFVLIPLIWIMPADSIVHVMDLLSDTIGKWISEPSNSGVRNALSSVFASLLGTLLLVWLSLRLAGAKSCI